MPLSDADAARALEAWLEKHLGSAERRATVRAVADRLEDLTGVEYDDLDEALELSTWPALVRKRFVGAWRRLKADNVSVPSVTPDPPRAAPTRVAAPPPLPLSPSSNAPTTASASDDDATRDETPARRPAKKAKVKAKAPAEPADATAGDAELARRLAMGLPPRRATRGPSPPPAPRRPPPEASDDTDDDFDELYSEVAAAAAPDAPWAVGDKVEAKFCVKSGQRSKYSRDFYPATITAIHGDTVDVEYDTSDEETEEQLPLRHVRKRRRAAAARPPAAAPPKKKKKAPAKTNLSSRHADLYECSRLRAQCLKRGIQCQGSATSMEWMRQKLAAHAGPEPADDLRAGGACFCRWGDKWYGAKILSVDSEGDSYRVHFLGWAKSYDGTYPAEAVRPAR